MEKQDIIKSFKDSLFTGLIALALFGPIVGLRTASKGEGLGNKFLSHIREVDAIAHVVRCFEDNDITHVSSKIDPLSDVKIITTELNLADIETLQNKLTCAKFVLKNTNFP